MNPIPKFEYLSLSPPATPPPIRPELAISRADIGLDSPTPSEYEFEMERPKFPVLPDPDITIYYDGGRHTIQVHKRVLCEQSAWFRKALEGYFMENGATRLRIRGDFCFAVQAMFNFMYTDNYPSYATVRASLHARYPRTTELDYHILVYTAADKYDIPAMRTLATKNYIELVERILAMDFGPLLREQDVASDISTTAVFEEDIMPFEESDHGIEAEFYRFINSVTLIWTKTPGRQDDMRYTVLEVIKTHLHKLVGCAEFVMLLTGDSAFYDDLEDSFEEDGMRLWIEAGDNSMHPLRFEG